MTDQNILPIGTAVVLNNGSETKIKSYKRGWYTGENKVKFRAKQITETPDIDDEEELEAEVEALEEETENQEVERELEDGEDEDEEDDRQTMSQTLKKYSQMYIKAESYSGRKSLVSDNDLSAALAGLDPATVIYFAEKILDFPEGELLAKYAHLNPGQKRMTAGNRLRAAIKRGDITEEEVIQTIAEG